MSEEEKGAAPERPKFYDSFRVQVPESLHPGRTIVTILMPNEDDEVIFSDPEAKGGKRIDIGKELKAGRLIAAALSRQKPGDCVVVNYLMEREGETKHGVTKLSTSSAIEAFRFAEDQGWVSLKGQTQFSV